MFDKSSNIPMWIISRVFSVAVSIGISMLAFECVIQVIAWMGYVPSYEDTPLFYKQVGIPIFIPTSIYVVYCYYEFQIELEEKRLEIDSQPARIEPVFTQSLEDDS